MYLVALQLRNFRNYPDLHLTFSPGLNVIYGSNAQGKTNLLEAIYLVATGKSHRAGRDQELIHHGARELRVRAQVARQAGVLDLELGFGHEVRKSLTINGIPERRMVNLVGKLAAVFFSPDDLMLLKGPPAGRRRFLDIELSQISATYLHHLQAYTRVLLQRNTILRNLAAGQATPGLLEILDEQLLDAAAEIVARRVRAVARLADLATRHHTAFTAGRERLELFYTSAAAASPDGRFPAPPPAAEVRQHLAALLRRRRREEIARAATLIGPHRDDLVVFINGQDARLYASQGQQRTAVLALKLAELDFMRAEIGEAPVLLLDDVASELDPSRRQHLVNAFHQGIQTFVSCTDLADLATRNWPRQHRLFRVTAGRIHLDQGGLT